MTCVLDMLNETNSKNIYLNTYLIRHTLGVRDGCGCGETGPILFIYPLRTDSVSHANVFEVYNQFFWGNIVTRPDDLFIKVIMYIVHKIPQLESLKRTELALGLFTERVFLEL